MKNIMIMILVSLGVLLHAQNDKYKGSFGNTNVTTTEEYNYLSMGIEESIKKGLDIKKGYTIDDKEDFSELENYKIVVDYYSFVFASLKRKDKTTAGIIVKAHSKVTNKTYYIAIPTGGEENDTKLKSKLNTFDSQFLKAFTYAYIKFMRS